MNNFFKKGDKMKNIFNKLKNNKGNSLAEFAVTAAMMATLATTAAPAFSGVSEAAKEKESLDRIDRIMTMIEQFYYNKATDEGRGRIPGQQTYQTQLGQYSELDDIVSDLTVPPGGEAPYNKWDSGEGTKWLSVFGTNKVDVNYLGGVQDHSTGTDASGNTYYQYDEMLSMLQSTGGVIESPWGEGHYIYAVLPGGVGYYTDPTTGVTTSTNCNSCGPIVIIADAFNPSVINKIQSFN